MKLTRQLDTLLREVHNSYQELINLAQDVGGTVKKIVPKVYSIDIKVYGSIHWPLLYYTEHDPSIFYLPLGLIAPSCLFDYAEALPNTNSGYSVVPGAGLGGQKFKLKSDTVLLDISPCLWEIKQQLANRYKNASEMSLV